MSDKNSAPLSRYEMENAARNIKDYYNMTPCEAATGKQQQAFERAKQEYIAALTAGIESAKKMTFADVFPKAMG